MEDTEARREPGSENPASEVAFRRRFLEQVCARRHVLVVVFVFSTMVFLVSIGLIVFVDLSAESRAIAFVDAGLTGVVGLGSFALLRQCRRLQRGR